MGRLICAVAMMAVLTCTAIGAHAELREAIIWGGVANSAPFGSDGEQLGGDPRSAAVVGMGFIWPVGNHIAIGLDGRYTQKGATGKIDTRYADPDSGFILDGTIALDYIEVPLLFTVFFPFGGNSEVRGYAGASVNFLIRSAVSGTLDGHHFDSEAQNVNDLDYSGVVGAAYEYRMKSVAFAFDARLVGSFTSVVDGGDVKLRAFEFTIGLGIPLGEDHF
jgi:hypothetical protein